MDDEPLRLAHSNRAYVGSVAGQYTGMGLSYTELLSIGYVGMDEASKKFDPSRGVKFISYADSYIRKEIRRALTARRSIIRIPEGALNKINRVKKSMDRLEMIQEHKPTVDSITDDTGLSELQISDAMQLDGVVLSLDAPVVDKNERRTPMVELLSGAEKPETNTSLYKAILKLTRRERYVIIQSVIYDKPFHEIGIRFGVSREIIRRIKDRAIEKLRKHLQKEGNHE